MVSGMVLSQGTWAHDQSVSRASADHPMCLLTEDLALPCGPGLCFSKIRKRVGVSQSWNRDTSAGLPGRRLGHIPEEALRPSDFGGTRLPHRRVPELSQRLSSHYQKLLAKNSPCQRYGEVELKHPNRVRASTRHGVRQELGLSDFNLEPALSKHLD